MDIYEYMQGLFPNVEFTGGSGIHASFFREVQIGTIEGEYTIESAMQVLEGSNISTRYFDLIKHNFGVMEFFISNEELRELLLSEGYAHLTGGRIPTLENMFVNPTTKNKFLTIAKYKDVVGGIRFWAKATYMMSIPKIFVGFRFRLIKPKIMPSGVKIRTAVEVELDKVEALKAATKEMHINEPHKVRVPKVRVPNIG